MDACVFRQVCSKEQNGTSAAIVTVQHCNMETYPRWIGPYYVVKDKWEGHAYELDIPARTRIHNVIHVSLLKPFKLRTVRDLPVPVHDPVLGQPDARQVDIEEDLMYNVEKFVDSRCFGHNGRNVRHVKYRVRWQGYKPCEDTW